MATPTGVGAGTETVSRIPADVQSAADSAFDNSYTDDKKVQDATAALAPAPTEVSNTEAPATDVKAQEAAVSNTPSEAKPTDAEPAEWKNLLAKYNGDRAAAGKAYWETNNRNAELARKNEELTKQLEATKAGSNPVQTAPQQSQTEQQLGPELRRYAQKILSVETAYQRQNQDKQTYLQEGQRLDQNIATIRRQLASGNLSIDRDDLTAKLVDALDSRDKVTQYVDYLDSQMTTLDDRWQELQSNQEQVKRTLTLEKQLREDREAKERASEDASTHQFRSSWNGTIDAVSKDVSAVPASSAEAFVKFVKARGKAQVADGEPIMDVEKFVRDTAVEFKGMLEAESNARFATYSKSKTADTTLNAPTGKNAQAPKTEAGRASWTPQQWEDHYESNPPF